MLSSNAVSRAGCGGDKSRSATTLTASLCARARINVVRYTDRATGTLLLTRDGGGHFTEVVLHPEVIVAEAHMLEKARHFHGEVHKYCFIARSVNFLVRCEAVVHSR